MDSIELLQRCAAGDAEAEAALYETCYADLHARADRLMRAQNGHTLQATALINEAWLRLALPDNDWGNRRHFLAAATKAMRCVLVDHARARLAEKRGGGAKRELLLEDMSLQSEPSWRLLALDESLERLEKGHPVRANVAQLRIFAGLSHREIGEALELSERSIERHWAAARESLREDVG